MILERRRGAANDREIGDERLAPRAAGKMAFERGQPLVAGTVGRPGAIDVVAQQVFVALAVHRLNSARSFSRALCTWDFEVPSETPRIPAISRCSNPSTSCRRNAARDPGGSEAIAFSRS